MSHDHNTTQVSFDVVSAAFLASVLYLREFGAYSVCAFCRSVFTASARRLHVATFLQATSTRPEEKKSSDADWASALIFMKLHMALEAEYIFFYIKIFFRMVFHFLVHNNQCQHTSCPPYYFIPPPPHTPIFGKYAHVRVILILTADTCCKGIMWSVQEVHARENDTIKNYLNKGLKKVQNQRNSRAV